MRYKRTWKRLPKSLSRLESRIRRATTDRVSEPSLADMLRLSSTITATMFCCGLSEVTLIAGCHKRSSSVERRADCKSHRTTACHPLTVLVRWDLPRQITVARIAAERRIPPISTHLGQDPRNTMVPREKALAGY